MKKESKSNVRSAPRTNVTATARPLIALALGAVFLLLVVGRAQFMQAQEMSDPQVANAVREVYFWSA